MALLPFDAGTHTTGLAYDPRDADVFSDADGAADVGTYRGATLAPSPDAPCLADAAEEISMHFTEAVELFELDEHDARAEERLRVSDDDIDAYFDASKQRDPLRRRELIDALLNVRGSGAGLSPRALLARAYPDDPSRQFVVLREALRDGERRLADPRAPQAAPTREAALATLERLRDAAAALETAHGPRIRADLNTIAVAGASGAEAADVRRFQAGYHDVVLGRGTLAATLQTLLGTFGGSDPRAALTRLTQALGRDLASARPSTDAVRLQALLHDQFHAATALTVLERCASLLDAVARAPASLDPSSAPSTSAACSADDTRAQRLMAAVVALSDERWPAASRFAELARSEGGTSMHGQIGLLTGLRAILRDLPVQVFHDVEHRTQTLGVAQDALDALIDASETPA